MKEIIELKKIETPTNDKIYQIFDALDTTSRLLRTTKSKHYDTIEKIRKEYSEETDNVYKQTEERLNLWKTLIGRYWKMNIPYIHNGKVLCTEINYILPYDVIEENETVWFLIVKSDDPRNGSVGNENYEITNIWLNRDMTLTEITKEEFIEKAEAQTEAVINYRLNKLKNLK